MVSLEALNVSKEQSIATLLLFPVVGLQLLEKETMVSKLKFVLRGFNQAVSL